MTVRISGAQQLGPVTIRRNQAGTWSAGTWAGPLHLHWTRHQKGPRERGPRLRTLLFGLPLLFLLARWDAAPALAVGLVAAVVAVSMVRHAVLLWQAYGPGRRW
ncbi:hypothetical protein [Parafrankia discariae]|uniref:hypothetical protein n=1 Tax=Parafrankia discariae TaxID=365528 RepID=UPI00035DFA93|nr:hypothetical protein [Parafrankia discariae]